HRPGNLPGYGRVLELVELGPAGDEVEDAVDRDAGPVGVATGAVHHPHEDGLAVGDERRHAENLMVGDRFLVGLPEHLEGRRAGALDGSSHTSVSPSPT